MGRLSKFLTAAVLVSTLAACSANPATGNRSFTSFMSPEKEKQVGFNEHPKILKMHNGAYSAPQMTRLINRIGASLVKNSEMPNLKFTFTLLNDDLVNAFALPGGYIYITRGLLALAENEAEVAGVLAHEIGHVTARHTAQRYSQGMAANIGMMAVGILVGNQAVSQAAGLGAQAYLQGFSREHEMEADMLAVRYMTRAGYSPKAMETFFRKMGNHKKLEAALVGEKSNDGFDLMATHPRTADRINQAIRLAKQIPVANPRVGRESFLRTLEGTLYGDDPKQGIRKGRDFIHGDLGLMFTVPPGFHLINGKDKVVAKGPDGAIIIFDMAGRQKDLSQTPLTAYISRMWAPKLNFNTLEPLKVNGLQAATAATRIKNNQGLTDLRLVAVRHPKGVFRFLFATPAALGDKFSTEYKRTTYSFRALTAKEKANVRPLRLKAVTVRKNDTFESIARWMPFETKRVERLKLINQNLAGRPLVPGTRIKVITQ
ncbi:MAG: M48 family metalloprotease [Rhodospirillales bacterium]|nr:M48 family metalloprotease [Rhodospirillales bacterium]